MDIGSVQSVDIDNEMRSAYIDYAMSVIVSRALPDARDGLKPGHRRILYAMQDMGIRPNTAFKKSARIVGEVLGKYHPHGDMAVYEAMARMAQDFSMRYMLVEGQGNFGSVDGDAPAAMRYTEARMAKISQELLLDIDKDTVDFIDNFDGSLQEPVVLPSRLPNLLLNGASGIAVGMATNVPPHNLHEIGNAVNYIIDNYDNISEITVNDLMQFVSGPDFPTGGVIIGAENIRQGYTTGKGKLTLRGSAQIEESNGGRYRIIITEIPYQVNKSSLVERIAELVRSDKLRDIVDLRDESDRRGMRIVIELKRNSQPKKVLNRLFKYTALQTTFGMRILALVRGEPRVLSLKQALQIFVEHRVTVITRRTEHELEKARQRAHILDGLLIALANLDDIIKTIRESKDTETARTQLMDRFRLSEIQANAILDMQLRRLSALERQKIEDEHKQIMDRIAYLEDLLEHPKKILALIKDDIAEICAEYGDERRTKIAPEIEGEFSEEDLVADEPVLVSITEKGYIKRVSLNVYRTLGRGRKGVTGQNIKDEDELMSMFHARTLHTILFFSDLGKVYSQKVYQIPSAGRTDRGSPMVNLLPLEPGENITAAVPVADFADAGYCMLTTTLGQIKRLKISEFSNVRPSGLIAMKLQDDERLGWARITTGNDEIIIVTEQGQSLRISEDSVRPTSRQAGGVRAIRLKAGDRLTSVEVIEPSAFLLVVTENGFGKRTPLDAYPIRGRATSGIKTINQSQIPKIGKIVASRVVHEKDQITIMTVNGMVLRLKVSGISVSSRATRGVKLMDLTEGDQVASLARITYEQQENITDKKEDEEKVQEQVEVIDTDAETELEIESETESEDDADE